MSQSRSIFRPGQGATIGAYTAGVCSAAMYASDWVTINFADAPSAQGVTAGEFEGKTLGSTDFIEVGLADTTAGHSVGCLGCLVGKSITSVANWLDVSGSVMADGDVCIIQYRGVHPNARMLTGGAAGEYLIVSSTAGSASNVTTAAAGLTGITEVIGLQIAANAAYTRAAADVAGPSLVTR